MSDVQTPSNGHVTKYSYLGVPTLRDFANSTAFFRVVVGPFGCFPANTEFLTPSGWVAIEDYRAGDQVAQWNKETNGLEFVEPTSYIKLPCTEFIKFNNRSMNMVLSEEHRVPNYDYAGKFNVRTASEIEKVRSRRTIPTTFCGHNNDALGMSDDLIRFAVMMHADGHYPKAGFKATVTLRRERKKARLRMLLARLEIEWQESVSPQRPTEYRFRFVPPYVGKRYTGRWWAASKRELAIVLDEMQHWDGLAEHQESVFTTSVKEDADFVQYAAHANGKRAIVHAPRNNRAKCQHHSQMYFVRITTGDNVHNKSQIRENTTISRVKSEDGFKYCFEVPSSFLIMRHEGFVFITGNSGKSSASIVELVSKALQQKPGPDGVARTRWLVVRNTYRQLADSTIKSFLQWFPPAVFGNFKLSTNTYTITAFENCEIEIQFRALDKPSDVGNLLSVEATGAWLNEGRELPWAIIEAIQGRVGRYPAQKDGGPTWYGIWMDTNPSDTDSKLYKYACETEHDPKYFQLFMQPDGLGPTAENLKNLPGGQEYYKRMAVGKDPEWVKVYCRGQWGYVNDGMPVFPEYYDATHCSDKIKPITYAPMYRGWDWGLTPSCIFLQLTPTGQLFVHDEMVSESMSVDVFADEVISHSTINYPDYEFIDIGDPAGTQRAQTDAKTCFQILESKGIQIEAGLQSSAIRLESVRRPLTRLVMGKPGFQLHPRCKMLRKGFMGGYQFRRLQTKGERFTSAPDKNAYSHPHDALQYPLTRIFGEGLTTYTGPKDADRAKMGDGFEDMPRSDITGY